MDLQKYRELQATFDRACTHDGEERLGFLNQLITELVGPQHSKNHVVSGDEVVKLQLELKRSEDARIAAQKHRDEALHQLEHAKRTEQTALEKFDKCRALDDQRRRVLSEFREADTYWKAFLDRTVTILGQT